MASVHFFFPIIVASLKLLTSEPDAKKTALSKNQIFAQELGEGGGIFIFPGRHNVISLAVEKIFLLLIYERSCYLYVTLSRINFI